MNKNATTKWVQRVQTFHVFQFFGSCDGLGANIRGFTIGWLNETKAKKEPPSPNVLSKIEREVVFL